MNGQSFAFHGYLPIRENERRKAITDLERESAKSSQTQIFMETPHRNKPLLDQLLQTCQPSTKLCIACNLTADDQFLKTQRIMEWKNGKLPDIEKKPCLFLLLAN
jgi:16S rRNA (cytidine1402-2'-O)-methyltransferase